MAWFHLLRGYLVGAFWLLSVARPDIISAITHNITVAPLAEYFEQGSPCASSKEQETACSPAKTNLTKPAPGPKHGSSNQDFSNAIAALVELNPIVITWPCVCAIWLPFYSACIGILVCNVKINRGAAQPRFWSALRPSDRKQLCMDPCKSQWRPSIRPGIIVTAVIEARDICITSYKGRTNFAALQYEPLCSPPNPAFSFGRPARARMKSLCFWEIRSGLTMKCPVEMSLVSVQHVIPIKQRAQ